MALQEKDYMTPTELENEYEFKLTKKILKKEFPWIIDILPPNEEDINRYGLLFLRVVIDPYKLQKMLGYPLARHAYHYIVNPRIFGTIDGKYAYQSSYLSTMYDMSFEEGRDLQDEIEDSLRAVRKSKAIPDELKIKKKRNFSIGEFLIPTPQHLPIPNDVIVKDKNLTN